MPFKRPFDTYYTTLLSPAIKEAGYVPLRADEIYGTRPVIEDIFREITESSALVADVTGKNPNVNYELGVAHALRRPVVIMSQRHEDIPFDYKHIRTIIYHTADVDWQETLRSKIVLTLKNIETKANGVLDPDLEFFPDALELARSLSNAKQVKLLLAGGDCFYRRLYEALHIPGLYLSNRRPDIQILLRRSSEAATRSSTQLMRLEEIFDMRINIRWYDWDFMLRGYCFDDTSAFVSYFLRTKSPQEDNLTGRYNRMMRISHGRSPLDNFLLHVFVATFESFFNREDALSFESTPLPFVKEL